MDAISPEAAQAICRCNHCNKSLQFTCERAGETVRCPNCGMETTLYLPGGQPEPDPRPAPPIPQIPPPADEPPPPRLVEDSLESIGNIFFAVGIIGAILCGIGLLVMIGKDDYDRPGSGTLIGTVFGGLVCIGQGVIIKTIFRSAAEHLRLLRRIAK